MNNDTIKVVKMKFLLNYICLAKTDFFFFSFNGPKLYSLDLYLLIGKTISLFRRHQDTEEKFQSPRSHSYTPDTYYKGRQSCTEC